MVRRRQHSSGFTLIEMVIVVAIIMILLSIAIPSYQKSIVTSREAVLRQNLFTMRTKIEEFTLDKQRAPQSLDDLVAAGYLKEVPTDPCTRAKDWQTVQEDVTLSVDQQQPGISDVHSNCPGNGTDGTAYNTW
jgi:general secretion pathway protein G